MYQAEYTKKGELKHSTDCKMAFGKKDAQCPRCVELLNGSQARTGWQADYYRAKRQEEAHILDIRNHAKNCKCGTVCTYGEW